MEQYKFLKNALQKTALVSSECGNIFILYLNIVNLFSDNKLGLSRNIYQFDVQPMAS